ncbi:MAG: hypothetical protein JO176_06810, partial [Acidimicrobiia bacterium]|nr:hypothetical protein [Acidimicrobiia bacterium]
METPKAGSSRQRVLGDLVAAIGCCLVAFGLAIHFQVPGWLARQSAGRNGTTADAVVFFLATMAIGLIVFSSRQWRATVRTSAQAEARRALYDPLTGLPNR